MLCRGADVVGGIGTVKGLFKFRDGILRGDFWLFGGAAEEGGDVEAGQGFDFIAVTFAGLSFWWDCVTFCQKGDTDGKIYDKDRPFLTFAAATSFSSLRFDFATSSSGGLEYLVSIS